MSHAVRATAAQAQESPHDCSQTAAHGQKCPLKSPEYAISETPAASERQTVIQGGYWGFKMISSIMKCPVICTAVFSWVCLYPQCVLLGGLETDFRIVIKRKHFVQHPQLHFDWDIIGEKGELLISWDPPSWPAHRVKSPLLFKRLQQWETDNGIHSFAVSSYLIWTANAGKPWPVAKHQM